MTRALWSLGVMSGLAMVAPVATPHTSSIPSGAQADTGRGYTPADVAFMQGMIAHHGQALTMAAMVPARTSRENMRLLAERIEVGQRDEIASMQRWLTKRHEEVPALDAQHQHHDAAGQPMRMPGMLTEEELAQLSKSSGSAFDRLFLQDMIRHHEGAITMVATLFASNGAGQEPEIFRFATDVDVDQRAEIKRMRALVSTLGAPRPH
jgi:uncharacterized protein (DUF305 family)